ncbi:MAG: T9SS type A sorting domain-containing protein [Bacteroidetes bacterium]|nr:T9SS type A sorting domain-containing protein [Bacteroidota bacterium]
MRTLWKIQCLLAALNLFIMAGAKAQCANNQLQSITYDSSVVSNGNKNLVFSFPRFDPSIGTLVSVKTNSSVSLNYGFILQNVLSVAKNISVSVGRLDEYTSTALTAPYINSIDTTLGTYLLQPGNSVTVAPSYVLNGYGEIDSITNNVVNFLGIGKVVFNYEPITYTSLSGSNTYYFSATVSDSVNFSVTYYYCNSSILANDLISFTANKQNDGKVRLNWSSVGSQTGRIYEVQACTDSSHFVSVGSVAGENNQSDYQYYYNIPTGASGKIYFRLKAIDVSGKFQYSDIRWVDIFTANNTAAYVFPNPSDSYINLVLNDPSNTDWETSIYASDGALIQKNHFGRSSLMHISFNNKLAPGTYFLKARSINTNKQQLFSFMVQ